MSTSPPADPADRLVPRVVFFGPPYSGKSALTAAFARAVGDPTDVVLTPAEPNTGLKRELVPHRLRVGGPGGGAVVVCDTDGKAAGDLLACPNPLAAVTGGAGAALAGAVRTADALVLVVDATADAAAVDELFAAFGRFLGTLEAGRTFGREAGGLPVFLTLTKCDALARPDDEPADWLARVENRKAEVRSRFVDYFGEDLLPDDSPFLPFGSIDLHLAATAVAVPPGPMFAAYADPDGSFGVAALAVEAMPAAREYRVRVLRSRQRLRLTATLLSVVSGVLFAGLLGLLVFGAGGDPLAARVRALQEREGPPAVRLSDRSLPRFRKDLLAVRESPRFDALPDDLRKYVTDRLAEVEAYTAYRAKFRPPRLGPPDVRTQAELAALEAAVDGPLAPPPEYATAWADTPAVRLREKWRADARLVREAEGRLYDWYRGLVRSANQLLLAETPPDAGWRGRVEGTVAAADAPPFRPADRVPGSPTVPVLRGDPLTYAPAFAFDRIDLARRDWDEARDRLLGLRDLCDTLGLTPGPAPAVLDLPEPVSDEESLRLGPARLRALAEAFPAKPLKHPEWAAPTFPDPVRRWLDPRLAAVTDTGFRHVRRLIAGRLGADAPAEWKKLPDTLLSDPAVRDWGHLLGLLRRWAGAPPADADPVAELAAFLRRDAFELAPTQLRVTVPDDLLADRLVPAGELVVRVEPTTGPATELRFRPVGDGRRDRPVTEYDFARTGDPTPVAYRPGDRLTATLPLRAGGADYRLVWTAPRSGVYQFDALARPPVLEKVGPVPAPERVPGVRAAAPAGGWPAAPDLLPAVARGP